jgi:beta-glucuronidase
MLRPQDSSTRERKSLNGLWRFALDAQDEGRAARWYAATLPNAAEMAVPASFNDIVGDEDRDHIGVAWYQTEARIPRGWSGERIFLHFESATHRATVWVNETELGSHEGGYTPFEFDITPLVSAGTSIRITAAVDNRLSWQSIPPGFVEQTPVGPRQRFWHDFYNYAGIHRSVWLYTTPTSHFTDVTIVTGLDGATGTIAYRTEIAHPSNTAERSATIAGSLSDPGGQNSTGELSGRTEVQVVLRDQEGTEVARGTGTDGTVSIENVHRWAPGDGYLYDLELLLVRQEEVVDSYHQKVGVRTVEVRGTEFLINGDPFYFTGFGKHEDIAVLGKAHSDAYLVKDFELLHWIGANSFRTSHYPYSEDVLDYADRQGIVVIDETAAVGLLLAWVGNKVAGEHRDTFSPSTMNDATRETHAQAIRELIARDKNHPCVVLWSIANEPETFTPESEEYFAPLLPLTRELDPTRPVGVVNPFIAPYGKCRVTEHCDVVMINRYYGWYSEVGDLELAERVWQEELEGWAREGKPILVTEYGADTYPGLHALPAVPWSEEYQVAYLDMNHRVFDRVDAVVGEHVWNFADFLTVSGVQRVGGNKKGIFTRDRQPKAAAFALRERWKQRS